ncbi:MAG: endonuclease [Comamonadaceae bacterium]|nr:MAG: endonuclease [Comamonadaceae bacterium]
MQEILPNFATLFVATCNMLNLARPQRQFYANQDPYDPREYQRKVTWLGERVRMLNADVLAVQEVWDDTALKDVIAASGLRYDSVAVPGAESTPPAQGAQGTPRVGIVTRLKVEEMRSFVDFPEGISVDVPELGRHVRFERPPLLARLRMKHGQPVNVLTVHLKSKRPKFLLDAAGQSLQNRDDHKIAARASLRSLLMRASEAAALRCIVIDLLDDNRVPLVVMGDFNDHPHSVTTQLVAATSDAFYDKAARDVALFNAYEMQGESALKKDVAYSHVHQGHPEVLDQIFVSEEFAVGSRRAIGDVRRVDYFNDHLHEGRDRTRTDHGLVRALLRMRMDAQAP